MGPLHTAIDELLDVEQPIDLQSGLPLLKHVVLITEDRWLRTSVVRL